MLKKLFCLIVIINITTLFADSVSTKLRTVTKIAEGVFVIRHQDAPNEFPQGNTTVIIGQNSVLVVDACYLPSSAKEDIEQIKKWTDKPVRFLVNTHYHLDHNNGNYLYAEAFPGITIISHQETQKLIATRSWNEVVKSIDEYDILKKQIESGKDEKGNYYSEQELNDFKKYLNTAKTIQDEFKNIKPTPPNTVFDNELNIDLGSRKVEIKFLGRGNTIGDIVVYLPMERIIAAGDLVVYPVPYAYLGYPSEWAKTLQKIYDMDVEIIVPGHGKVLKDKTYLQKIIAVINTVVEKAEQEIIKLGHTSRLPRIQTTVENVQNSIDWTEFRKYFGKGIKENEDFFDDSVMGGLVRAAVFEAELK